MKKYIILIYTINDAYYYYNGHSPDIENALIIDTLSFASKILVDMHTICDGEYYLYCEIREVVF